MSLPIIYRHGRMFKLNDALLPPAARQSFIKNAIYADLYKEFAGANRTDKYKNMTNSQKMEAVCNFVENWLKEKKYK